MAIEKVSFMVLQSIQFQLPLTKGWCIGTIFISEHWGGRSSSDDSEGQASE